MQMKIATRSPAALPEGKVLQRWNPETSIDGLAFSPDGKLLAAIQHRKEEEENDLILWDLAKKKIVKRFPIAAASCTGVVFSRDGKRVALAGYYSHIVQVYEIATGKELVRFKPHRGPAALTFSDDGTKLITGSEDTTILVWDLRSKAL